MNKYFSNGDNFYLLYNNKTYTKLSIKNLINNFNNIRRVSFYPNYIILKKNKFNYELNTYEISNFNDLTWALRIAYNGINFIDYNKKFLITYGTSSTLSSKYKIMSIIFE